MLTSFCNAPTTAHLDATKRILRYLKGTIQYTLRYGGDLTPNLYAFVDANFASTASLRTSYGLILMFNGPTSWHCSHLRHTVMCTTEREYNALCECVKDCVWIRNLIVAILLLLLPPTTIFEDNRGAIAHVEARGRLSRRRHYALHLHYIVERIADSSVSVKPLASAEMAADILTKLLPRPTIDKYQATTHFELTPAIYLAHFK